MGSERKSDPSCLFHIRWDAGGASSPSLATLKAGSRISLFSSSRSTFSMRRLQTACPRTGSLGCGLLWRPTAIEKPLRGDSGDPGPQRKSLNQFRTIWFHPLPDVTMTSARGWREVSGEADVDLQQTLTLGIDGRPYCAEGRRSRRSDRARAIESSQAWPIHCSLRVGASMSPASRLPPPSKRHCTTLLRNRAIVFAKWHSHAASVLCF